MAIVINDKYYFYFIKELIGGMLDKHGKIKSKVNVKLFHNKDFWKFNIDINGKKETFYTKKKALKKFELNAIYNETFSNYKLNGHSYMRPEMRVHLGDVVVDAGGCEGYYSRYALMEGAAKVIIFEPCSELAEGLKRTFEREISNGKVTIIEKALGRDEHTDTLFVNQNMFCASSISMENADSIKKEVPVVSLDKALKDIGVKHIDILKMDIEGAEIDAVIGARKVIKHCEPKLIIATYHSYYNAIRIKEICKRINCQYKFKAYGCYQFDLPWRPYLTLLYKNQCQSNSERKINGTFLAKNS